MFRYSRVAGSDSHQDPIWSFFPQGPRGLLSSFKFSAFCDQPPEHPGAILSHQRFLTCQQIIFSCGTTVTLLPSPCPSHRKANFRLESLSILYLKTQALFSFITIFEYWPKLFCSVHFGECIYGTYTLGTKDTNHFEMQPILLLTVWWWMILSGNY